MDALPEPWRSVDATADELGEEAPDPALRRRLLLLGVAATTLSIAAAGLLLLTPTGSGVATSGVTAVVVGSAAPASGVPSTVSGLSTAGAWMIDVGGAVARPGLYALPPGSRVADAIRAAGGYGAQVDAAAASATLNLAEVLHDGQKVRVPERGAAGGTTSPGTAGDAAGRAGGGAQIDLNHASATELDALPGVGPVTVGKIIAAREERPFRTLDELVARKVISASVLAKIRGLATVGP